MKKFLSTVVIGTALVAGSMSVQASQLTDNGPAVIAMIQKYNSSNPVCVAAVAGAIKDKRGGFSVNIDRIKRLAILSSTGDRAGALDFGSLRKQHQRLFNLRGANGLNLSPTDGNAPKLAIYRNQNQPNQVARICVVQNKVNSPDFKGFKKKEFLLKQISSNNDRASVIDVLLTRGG